MAERFDYSVITDEHHVVMIDGFRVGYAVSEDDAETIVAWLKSASEEIEIKVVTR